MEWHLTDIAQCLLPLNIEVEKSESIFLHLISDLIILLTPEDFFFVIKIQEFPDIIIVYLPISIFPGTWYHLLMDKFKLSF